MGESQYSYQGLPDPSSYFPGTRDPGEPTSTPGMLTTGTPNIMGTPNIFIHDNLTQRAIWQAHGALHSRLSSPPLPLVFSTLGTLDN